MDPGHLGRLVSFFEVASPWNSFANKLHRRSTPLVAFKIPESRAGGLLVDSPGVGQDLVDMGNRIRFRDSIDGRKFGGEPVERQLEQSALTEAAA